jgi:hypothetical protein
MVTPTLTPDWITTGVLAFNSFVESNPNAEQRIDEIIKKRLDNSDAGTWQAVFVSLENYLGKEPTDVFEYVLQTQVGQQEILQELSKSASPQTMNILRIITSLYGFEFEKAYLALKQMTNSWKTFYRDVHYDFVNQRYQIRVRFEKYNGEAPFIEGDADSILELTQLMIQTLLFVDSRDAFRKELVDQFIERANKFINFLQPSTAETPSEQAKS